MRVGIALDPGSEASKLPQHTIGAPAGVGQLVAARTAAFDETGLGQLCQSGREQVGCDPEPLVELVEACRSGM